MAHKIILSDRFCKKLSKMFAYFEKTFSFEVAKLLMETVDKKIKIVGLYPGIGLPSSKIPGVYRISVSTYNKLYYRVKGKKIEVLDLLETATKYKE